MKMMVSSIFLGRWMMSLLLLMLMLMQLQLQTVTVSALSKKYSPTTKMPPLLPFSTMTYSTNPKADDDEKTDMMIAFKQAHEFSTEANWLIPSVVLCGHYPGACPSRTWSDEKVIKNLHSIISPPLTEEEECGLDGKASGGGGIDTFVCLQDEIPHQEHGIWPKEGIPKKSKRAPMAKGNFHNYRNLMPTNEENSNTENGDNEISYVHYKLPDLSVAKTLNDLDAIISYLVERIENDNKIYIHCWGGRGRTGMIAACLLGALYADIDAEEALSRVQTAYSLRQPWRQGILSPETDEQKTQVRDWFEFKRTSSDSALTSQLRRTLSSAWPVSAPQGPSLTVSGPQAQAYGIWDKNNGTDILEIISLTGTHPFKKEEATKREGQADKLGNGRFGQVYRGRCEQYQDHTPVAIKVSHYLDDAPTHADSKIALESQVLKEMSSHPGFPQVYYHARQYIFGRPADVLVMQLLGRPILKRLWAKDIGDTLCCDKSFTTHGVLKMGRDLIHCLQQLHTAGYTHNDLKPMNMLFGADGSGTENDVHLVDFGMVTHWKTSEEQEKTVEGCALQCGGASPLFASVAQLEGRPTRPVDDMESLWYVLAYLVTKELPWQWEPVENLSNIKRQLFIDECGISSDVCTADLGASSINNCCSTKHCLKLIDHWKIPDPLHELWSYIIEGNNSDDEDNEDSNEYGTGLIDYEGCLEALAGSCDFIDYEGCLEEEEEALIVTVGNE